MPPLDPEKIIRRFKIARDDRRQWNSHWQEVADLVLPTRDFTVIQPGGIRRRTKIYDATAVMAHTELSATLDGLLTNAALKWFALNPADDDLIEDHEVKLWLEDGTNTMLRWLGNPLSGFATAIWEIYQDLIGFGTAVLFPRNDPDAMRFQAIPLANMYLVPDERDEIVTAYRHIFMAAHEIVARWGNAVSERVHKLAIDDKSADKKIEIIHCVQKRDKRDPQMRDGKNKAWASIYVEVKEKRTLSEGGFDDNPYLTPRFSKAPGEVYGRSPAMEALPFIKTANKIKKDALLAGALEANPPMNVPANSMEGPIRTGPGGLNYYRAGSRDRIEPVNTGAKPRSAFESLAHEQESIEAAFYLDKIRLPGISPQGGHPRMTAQEVIERRNQTLIFFSPILSRMYAELLSPVITRLFKAMRRRGDIPPPPQAINGRGMEIEYLSPLALSQRASEVSGFIQLMNVAAPLIEADPTVLQNLDADQTFLRLAHLLNTSPRMIRTREDVQQIRQAADQQQQLAQQAEIAQQLAKAGRDAAAGIKDVTASAA